MSQEGSIAPKESVNIVYKPAGEGTEEVELPLKMLSIGDYTGQTDETPIIDRQPININKDNFHDVMREHKLQLQLQVPDKLTEEENSELAVNLKFSELDDFTPEGLANQVPELKKLMELRNALIALKFPLSSISQFRGHLTEILADEEARNKLIAEVSSIEQGEPKDN